MRMSLSNKGLITCFSLHIRGCVVFWEIKNRLPHSITRQFYISVYCIVLVKIILTCCLTWEDLKYV